MSICEANGPSRFFTLPTGWPCLLFLFKKLSKSPRDGTKYTKMENGRKVKVLVTQSCLTLCDPRECSSPGSSVHGSVQAKILSGLPCPPPGVCPNPGIELTSFTSLALAGRFFTTSATWEAQRRHGRMLIQPRTTVFGDIIS